MAILIDPPVWPAHGTLWSHLISDESLSELHAFAGRLRVPRRSFDLDHYDLPSSLYDVAVSLGAREVSGKGVLRALQDSGLRVKQIDKPALRPVYRRQYLEAEWQLLGSALGADGIAPDLTSWLRLGGELIERWNEPHRAYHDERHLEDVLLALNQLEVRGERIHHSTLLAAWFHDAVYTGRGEDELASARFAAHALGEAGITSGLTDTVGELVLATVPASASAVHGSAAAHLLDADVSIFASARHRYDEYAASVRHEYAHVADAEFASARARILAAYLDQSSIYRTDTARHLWELRARENVAREIERLRG